MQVWRNITFKNRKNDCKKDIAHSTITYVTNGALKTDDISIETVFIMSDNS